MFRTLYTKLKDNLDTKKKITGVSKRGKAFEEDTLHYHKGAKNTNFSKSKECDCMEIYLNSKIQTISKHRKFHWNEEMEPLLKKIMDIELDIFNQFYKNK